MESHLIIEKVLPVFFGSLGALVLCAMVSVNGPGILGSFASDTRVPAEERSTGNGAAAFFAEMQGENHDLIREMYQETNMRNRVIDFFTRVCGSREIAETILSKACMYNVSVALAFALGWEESRFNPKAVNTKNRDGSIDRGLFQLNSRSFPGLDTHAFFDPEINTKYGMSHLRHCLDLGGTEITVLAMYNAGAGRVGSAGTPKETLDYINRILINRKRIESHFRVQVMEQEDDWITDDRQFLAEAEKLGRARLIPLSPLNSPRN